MTTVDLCEMECEEAMMTIRFIIRSHKLTSGNTLKVQSLSEPFWTRLNAWASSFEHHIARQDLISGWMAVITLN
jgi:hypothetical protein